MIWTNIKNIILNEETRYKSIYMLHYSIYNMFKDKHN